MRAIVSLSVANLFWAVNFVFSPVVLDEIDPLSLSVLRWVGAAPLLVVLAQVIERPDWATALRRWRVLVPLGLLGVGGYGLVLYAALLFTSSLNAALINGLNPAMIAVGAALLHGERLRARAVVGILIGVLGVVLVVTKGDVLAAVRGGVNVGDLIMLGAITIWTVYTLAGRRLTGVPPITATALQAAASAVALLVVGAIVGVHWPHTAGAWGALAAILLLPTVGAYVLWNTAVRRVPAATASVFLNLILVFTALLGLAIGRPIGAWQAAGGVLVVASVLLVLLRGRRPRPTATDAADAVLP